MSSILNLIADWWPIVFFVLFFVTPIFQSWFSLWSFGKEVDGNKKFETPEEHQVFWHVVHNRQDIKAIYFMTSSGFATVIALLLWIAHKLSALS
jgi:hypothetical protein